MTEPQQTPAEALDSIRRSRAVVADKVAKGSWTYDLIYSSIGAVMVAGQVAPLPFNVLASAGGAVAFALLARKWAQKTGVFVSGVTPKRASAAAFKRSQSQRSLRPMAWESWAKSIAARWLVTLKVRA